MESIKSSTTPDPGYQWESDKLTVRHHKREPRGQPFPSMRPQGTYKTLVFVSVGRKWDYFERGDCSLIGILYPLSTIESTH